MKLAMWTCLETLIKTVLIKWCGQRLFSGRGTKKVTLARNFKTFVEKKYRIGSRIGNICEGVFYFTSLFKDEEYWVFVE